MGMSESEVATVVGVAVVLNGLGVWAWRQDVVGAWFLWALGIALLAVLVDPLQLPGVSLAGCISTLLLALVGPGTLVRRHRDRRALASR